MMQSRFPTGNTAPSASGDVCIPARSCACGVWCVHLCLRVSTGMCVHSTCVHICACTCVRACVRERERERETELLPH